MATSHRFRRAPAPAEREPTIADGGLKLVLLIFVIGLGAGMFALALLPAVGAAGRTVQRFSDEFTRLGADVELTFPRFPERSTIYAADGSVLATVFLDENRKVVRLRRMGDLARKAVLAIEDERFYDHPGLDYRSILRAVVANVTTGEIQQGASTITQQLARNAFGISVCGEQGQRPSDPCTERTLARKIAEARVAMRLEEEYSKEEILELYLNDVYFGRGVYGIGTAAQFYFSKPPKKLALHEAALLAGLIAAPEQFTPVNNRAAALERRNVVLGRMADAGFITPQEAQEARETKLGLAVRDPTERQRAPFFLQYLKNQILSDERFGKTFKARQRTLFQGGLKIHTTIEPKLQRAGLETARRWLPDAEDPESAIASIEASTGAIRALVSSQNFDQSQVNLATGQGGTGRQAGSAFKPFTLVAAFEKGIPPAKVYNGASGQEVDCGPGNPPYRVVNADGGGGKMDLWSATQRSVNAVFVQLSVDAGLENVVEVANRMGIDSELLPVCSLTLGTNEVTPLEMASAFATLANGGKHCEPFAIQRVLDRRGKPLEGFPKKPKPRCKQVVEPEIAALTVNMLENVVGGGTGTRANLGTWPVFGKTGTTNDYGDAWFVGCTVQVCTSSWVGHEKGRISMSSVNGFSPVYGGTIPALIWHDFMLQAMQGLPAQSFPPTPQIRWPTVRVPDVVGRPVGEAERVLGEAGFAAVVEEVPSKEPAGTVVGQSPRGGARVTLGTTVNLQVSTGKAPRTKVPDVVGMTEPQAKAALRNAGFAISVSYEKTNHENQNGIVAAQSPGAGSRAKEGSTVTISVLRYEKDKGGGEDEEKPPKPSPSPSPSPTPDED